MKNIHKKNISLTLKSALLGLSLTAVTHAMAAGYPVKTIEVVVGAEGQEEFYVLADSTGKTVYTFDPDPANGVPACNGRCAEVWAPILLKDEEANTLVAPYAFVTRTTGLKQLTHNGKALYNYYLDRNPADILGDKVGNVWHIVKVEDEVEVPPAPAN